MRRMIRFRKEGEGREWLEMETRIFWRLGLLRGNKKRCPRNDKPATL